MSMSVRGPGCGWPEEGSRLHTTCARRSDEENCEERAKVKVSEKRERENVEWLMH